MKGIILASHGPLAEAALESVKLFVGEIEHILALALNGDESPESFKLRLKDAIDQLDQKDGVLLLTDIPGGTPSNIGLMIASDYPDLQVVSGLNMIMLMEAILTREFTPSTAQWVESSIQSGQASIQDLIAKLKEEKSSGSSELDDLLDS
jgi:N-acetylgalactosamine PTS system EIIA component